MRPEQYKGFTITPRTFQIRGTGRWTLDLLIGQRELLRAFSTPSTYRTEAEAEAGCLAFAHRVIDANGRGCPLLDLSDDPIPGAYHHAPLHLLH